MRIDDNLGSHTNYYPNKYGDHQDNPRYKKPALELNGAAYEWNFREDDDNYFEQPGKFFNLMTADEQQRLFDNTAREISLCQPASSIVISDTAIRQILRMVKALQQH